MRPRCCTYCGQVLPEFRLGVRLPVFKARLFDLVLRGGRDGIPVDDLYALAYGNNRPFGRGWREGEPRCRKTLYVHITQINELIDDVGYRIVCSGGFVRLLNKINDIQMFHHKRLAMKHRATTAHCADCKQTIRVGLRYCRVCLNRRRRAKALKGWRTRRLMATARAAS